jgi:hypothetical protein
MPLLAVAKFFETNIADALTAAAAVVTMFIAIAAVFYARRELIGNRDAARIELTFKLYEHQLDPEFSRHMAMTGDLITIDAEGTERERIAERRWRQWRRLDRAGQTQTMLYLNHLEIVGGLYKLGRLDHKATMQLFGYAAEIYWDRADWFIARVRLDDKAAFDKWQVLAEAHRSSG